jgi:hypothetical protein
LPSATVVHNQVVYTDWFAIRFDDLWLNHDAIICRLFAEDFEALAGITIEPLSIDRSDVALERLRGAVTLRSGEHRPGRPDRPP